MDAKELYTLFKNHRHSGTHPDARRIDIASIIGVSGSTAIVLISPNGTRYLVYVDDDGSLATELFAAKRSLYVVNSNGKKFLIGVADDGALTSEPFTGSYGDYVFYEKIELSSDNGTRFQMGVYDDGTLYTTTV